MGRHGIKLIKNKNPSRGSAASRRRNDPHIVGHCDLSDPIISCGSLARLARQWPKPQSAGDPRASRSNSGLSYQRRRIATPLAVQSRKAIHARTSVIPPRTTAGGQRSAIFSRIFLTALCMRSDCCIAANPQPGAPQPPRRNLVPRITTVVSPSLTIRCQKARGIVSSVSCWRQPEFSLRNCLPYAGQDALKPWAVECGFSPVKIPFHASAPLFSAVNVSSTFRLVPRFQ